MKQHWHDQYGEPYCAQCADMYFVQEGDLSSNETDTPQNCVACDRLCEYTLTEAGIQYVIDTIMTLLDEEGKWVTKGKSGYYKGVRAVEIVRDWAEDLNGYVLCPKDNWIVKHFLKLTKVKSRAKKK